MKKGGLGTGIMYILLVLLMVGLGFLIFFNYRANMDQKEAIAAALEAAVTTPTAPPTATPEPTAVPERTAQTVTLAFAGDLVGQAGLTTDAQGTGGNEGETTYDFTQEIAGVIPSLEGADLSVCTLVGTLSNSGEYDSYHMPASMATALYQAGFRLVNVATDHILDRNVSGLTETVTLLNNAGIGALGAYNSTSHSVPMASVNGVNVAFLSYTYSTAGTGSNPMSVADSSWCLDILTTDYMTDKATVDYEKIDADIAAVKQAGADVIVCFVYWWDSAQYYTEPRAQQTEVVDYLCDSGVDVIIGGGVKVPQPIEVRTVEREDGSRANCVVCYSLSNLMSCFNDNYTNISATVKVTVSRDVDSDEVWISGVSTHPLFMLDTDDFSDYDEPGFRYRLLDPPNAISSYLSGSGLLTAQAYEALTAGTEDIKTLMGAEYAEETGGASLEFPY